MRALILLIVALVLSVSAVAQSTGQISVTGFLTDTLCGKRGATANHIEHAKRSVASGKAKYAIYDERTKQLYILESGQVAGGGSQVNIEPYLGQRVTITGTLSATPVKRAGESVVAPDAAAAARGEQPTVVRNNPRAGAPLDTSTPVAGVLSISSIAPAGRTGQ